MSNKKSGKIPRLFRGKLGLKKFNSINRMLTDKSERELFESSFPEGVNGKHQYVKPENEKKAAKLKGLLKNINKVRSGPRMIRLIVVFIILIAPVVFNFLFLDK
ncbi:MAG: hypothetical protein KAH21_09730, partial [Spirochaetaceae bacterium]|nr:hypothetical protein [Spirochaetaceae bacterium]